MKQPFRRGVNFNYVRINFSSQYRLKTSFDVQKVDQVYSNTRVPTRINTSLTQVNMSPTRVNTNQHKPDMSQYESARINTNPTPVNTSQHESTRVNASQLDQEIIIIYCSLVGKV